MTLSKQYMLIALFAAPFIASCAESNLNRIEEPRLSTTSEVTIKIDGFGTPHIYAQDNYGLYYGYGYALAKDRLYQLEILKHSTQGRVSEILGADWVEFDKSQQKLFWPDDILSQFDNLKSAEKDIFLGMANGINARLTAVRSEPNRLLPLEFTQNDFQPSDWTAYDVAMLFVGSMLLRYGDFNSEIANEEFLAELIERHGDNAGRTIFDLINPTTSPLAPTVIAEAEWPKTNEIGGGKHFVTPNPSRGQASTERGYGYSNALVVSAKYLKHDKAVLINGPQFGWYVPAYTYSAGFHLPGWDAVGNAPVGYPLPMFGYNQHITWGTTWGASDNVDIFRESLNPENSTQYKHNGQWRDFETREINIIVKGGDDIVFTAYKSVHGPIFKYEPDQARAYAKSRGWSGREFSTLMGWIEATQAHDHSSWRDAVSQSALNVNWYYADKMGNIAYFAGGAYPDRAPGHDNRLPVSGEGDMDWRGIKPLSTNPQVLNPASGYIANWNNKPAKGFANPDEWWYSWMEADRVEILNDLIEENGKMSADEIWSLMMDASYVDPNAHYFKPHMIKTIEDSNTPAYRAVAEALKEWDDTYQIQSGTGSFKSDESAYVHPGNAIFRAWLSNMLKRTLADDLPGNIGATLASTTGYGTPDAPTAAGLNISVGLKLLHEILSGRSNYDFLNGNSANAVWLLSLEDTVTDLTREYGSNIEAWNLPVPSTRFRHTNFMGVPQTLSTETTDQLHDMNRGTENNMTIFSGAEWPTGYEVVAPGQSGFISSNGKKSKHFDDQFEMFRTHGKKRVWLNDQDVANNTAREYTLKYSR